MKKRWITGVFVGGMLLMAGSQAWGGDGSLYGNTPFGDILRDMDQRRDRDIKQNLDTAREIENEIRMQRLERRERYNDQRLDKLENDVYAPKYKRRY